MKLSLVNKTEIYNLNNSFSSIYDGQTCLWMDPWKYSANLGAWSSWGENISCKEIYKKINIDKVDYIYISHQHTDHFDVKFLDEFLNLNEEPPIILIKNFKNKRFKSQIINVWGENKIIEINDFEIYKAGTFEVCMLPQISSSSTHSEGLVDYDLDTSIIIKTKDGVIFNEVDNPYSIKNYKEIILPKLNNINLNDINIAFLGYSGASDYPQSYLNIDRKSEQQKIKKRSINRFFEVGEILKTNCLIPAGGTYLLNEPFDYLNDLTAVPNFQELENHNTKKELTLVNSHSHFVELNLGEIVIKERTDDLPTIPCVNKNNNMIPYSRKIENISELKSSICFKINKIENEFPTHFFEIYCKLKTRIILFLHNGIPKYKAHKKLCEESLYSWEIFSEQNKNSSDKNISLEVHVAVDAFMKWTDGLFSWNELTFHCIYLRTPNVYEPDAMMFLNWYRLWGKK